MNIHYYKGPACSYPVGSGMDNAIKVAKGAARVFNKITNYPPQRPINIWCRGSSGAILAALFASQIKKREVIICHVKKEGEKAHIQSTCAVPNGINIIIDDFISTGTTVKAIHAGMYKQDFHHVDYLIVCGQSGTDADDLKCYIEFVPANLITNQM